MTFGFSAIGSKDEVVAQLLAYDDSNFGDLGKQCRDLLVSNLKATTGRAAHSVNDWDVKYDISGSGHGDTNSVNFRIECTAKWVPAARPDAVEVPEGAPGDVPSPVNPEASNG